MDKLRTKSENANSKSLLLGNIAVFEYNGNPIKFQKGQEDCMINATQMSKPFGKKPINWIDLPSTSQFIDSLIAVRKSDRSKLIKTINGVGTWMHEDVAMEFARWLSPAFAIWCNDRIKELMRYGITAAPSTIESILSDPENGIKLLTALKEEREMRQALETRVNQQNNALYMKDQFIEELQPDADYTREVLQSESTFNTTQIAKEFGWGAQTLNEKLRQLGVQYKQNGQWLLTCKYQNKGYTKTQTWSKGVGEDVRTYHNTVWTEKGRKFIHELLSKKAAS